MAPPKSTVVFQRLPPRRTFEDVVAQIRQRIASGELREGDRLPTERDFAAMMGVSRNTVREALRALEHAGMLELKPGIAGGAFISNGSTNVVKTAFSDLFHLGVINGANLTEARIVVTCEVARLACVRRTDKDIADLVEIVDSVEAALAEGNYPLRVTRNVEFYKVLVRAAGNPVLAVLTSALTDVTLQLVQAIGAMPNEFVIGSRRRMIEHIGNRDGAAASAEMADYLRTTYDHYLKRFNRAGVSVAD